MTVVNSDANSVSNVQLDGAIAVAGKGGVLPAGVSGPTLAATLAPGTTTSFTYLYTATNYGTVSFAAAATCSKAGAVVTSPLATSGNVISAPKADLMVKTAKTNDTTFVGVDEFQQPPPNNDQNWTLRVGSTGAAGYVVRLQNDTSTARTFVLRGTLDSFTNWNVQVLWGTNNILNAMSIGNGWTTPQLAPGADLDLQVLLAPMSGASVLENKSLPVSVLADGRSTDVLDSVWLHAILVPVPVQVTLLSPSASGLTPARNPLLSPADRTFSSFSLPPLLDKSQQALIDGYAISCHFQILSGGIVLLPQPLIVGSNYQYQLEFPTNLPPHGMVACFVQVFGPRGVTTDGVEWSSQGASNSQVTVTLDQAVVGDVVLSATYVSASNTVVATTATLVASLPPSGVALTGVQVLPGNIALPIGSTVSPQVVANYNSQQFYRLRSQP